MGEIVPLSDSYEPVMNQFDIPVVLISTVLMLRRRFKGHIVAAVTFLFDSCYIYNSHKQPMYLYVSEQYYILY